MFYLSLLKTSQILCCQTACTISRILNKPDAGHHQAYGVLPSGCEQCNTHVNIPDTGSLTVEPTKLEPAGHV
jgi:hypothetical protein